jgi:hypothetical protein
VWLKVAHANAMSVLATILSKALRQQCVHGVTTMMIAMATSLATLGKIYLPQK